MKRLRIWLGLFVLFACTAYGNLESLDTAFTLQAARALWERGDSGLRTAAQGAAWEAEAQAAGYVRAQADAGRHVYGKVGRGDLVYVWFPIGHVWLLVPAVAAGEALHRAFPGFEARYREHAGETWVQGQLAFAQVLIAMVLPAASGAASVVLLWLLAQALGAGRRDAAIAALSIALCTQFFPFARETLSDGPGLCFLLLAVLAVVRAHRGTASPALLAAGGFAAGAAVLTRYQHGVVVPVLLLVLALAARRRRASGQAPEHAWWRTVLPFALGGLPCLVALLAVDQARFGSPLDTGYPAAGSWFDYPFWFGVPKLLIAAGKGILWLSPPLWLALPLAAGGARRRAVPELRWFAWTMLLVPLLMFGSTNGWQSGQCWGARYVTPGVVLFLAIVLAQARPWRRWPRTFVALCAFGLVANVTSLVAPMRGHNQLAGQAVRAMYAEQLARGEITQQDFAAAADDPADHFFFLPRFSPLHANWTYACLCVQGALEDGSGRRRDGVGHTIEPLFGVTSANPELGRAPLHWEDRGFRWLWFGFLGALLGVPWWALLLPALGVAAALLPGTWRRLSRD